MTRRTPRQTSARGRLHQARHREMARHAFPDLDCIEEQVQAAEAMGDEYLAVLLKMSRGRLIDRLLETAG